jgi:hypothetical protein
VEGDAVGSVWEVEAVGSVWEVESVAKFICRNASRFGECWIWTGRKKGGARGYGHIGMVVDGVKYNGAHRVVYAIERGPIPEGMVLDHLCGDRRCVNPDHLEAVTQLENLHRRLCSRRSRGLPPR